MISIVIVNFNSYDFTRLLIESIDQFTKCNWDIVLVDNSSQVERVEKYHVHQFIMEENIGHGAGLNFGCQKAARLFSYNRYIMFLDCDTHFLIPQWESYFLEAIKQCDVIAAKGVPEKPIRPACMFMTKEVAISYDWQPSENYKGHRITPEGTDVAIRAYQMMQKDSVNIKLMDSFPNRYQTYTGEEWGLSGVPLIYHHWHGSHLQERQIDFQINLETEKKKMFAQIPWRIP